MAVAHSLFIAIYYIVRDHVPFKNLGEEDYYNKFNTESKINMYTKKLQNLGMTVNIEAAPALAWKKKQQAIYADDFLLSSLILATFVLLYIQVLSVETQDKVS